MVETRWKHGGNKVKEDQGWFSRYLSWVGLSRSESRNAIR